MIDLAASAQKEVHGWPVWKQEGFGVIQATTAGDDKMKPSSSSTVKNTKKVA
jgi:hypothetical protein